MSDVTNELVMLRRSLHRIPELSFRERETSQLLKAHVAKWGEVRPIAKTGFYVDMVNGKPERTLLLRADMDALPIHEDTGLPYASTHPGRMHACGHDGHMAALAVAGRLLSVAPPEGVRLRFLFQPSEEGGGGAGASAARASRIVAASSSGLGVGVPAGAPTIVSPPSSSGRVSRRAPLSTLRSGSGRGEGSSSGVMLGACPPAS